MLQYLHLNNQPKGNIMQTILVWLLVSVGADHHSTHAQVVERFKTKEQCLHVQNSLPESKYNNPSVTRCIQAEIVVTK